MNVRTAWNSSDIASSALAAERQRMDVIAQNIANAYTTRTPTGDPYRRQIVLFSSADLPSASVRSPNPSQAIGVQPAGIVEDQAPFPEIYYPGHPDADAQGMVRMPNVVISHEMIDLLTASRSYDANLKTLETFRKMVEHSLSILRGLS